MYSRITYGDILKNHKAAIQGGQKKNKQERKGMGDGLRKRQSKEKVKQHRARFSVGETG